MWIHTSRPASSALKTRRGARRLLAALALLLVGSSTAEAQFGFGFGFGGWARPYTPQSVRFLYNRSNALTRAGTSAPKSLKEPDRFDYRKEAVRLQERYDFQNRRSLGSVSGGHPAAANERGELVRVAPPPAAPAGAGARANAAANAAAQPPAAPVLPITSFVNEDNEVVWPADAPLSGDLAPKRQAAEEAIQDVAIEYRANKKAKVESAAEARKRLIDYGRPALANLRDNSTPRVADSFHLFLLSLYESLAQATRGPRLGASRPAPPPLP